MNINVTSEEEGLPQKYQNGDPLRIGLIQHSFAQLRRLRLRIEVRANLTSVSTGSGVGTISVTTDDIIDSVEIMFSERSNSNNTNSPGRIEDVEITKVL